MLVCLVDGLLVTWALVPVLVLWYFAEIYLLVAAGILAVFLDDVAETACEAAEYIITWNIIVFLLYVRAAILILVEPIAESILIITILIVVVEVMIVLMFDSVAQSCDQALQNILSLIVGLLMLAQTRTRKLRVLLYQIAHPSRYALQNVEP